MQNQNSLIVQLVPALKIPQQQSEFKLMKKKKTSLVSHVPPLFISGVIHPFLMVVLLLGSDELPALDPSLAKVYVPRLAFWCLCINVKFPSTLEQHCNVYFIGFISSFFRRGVVPFSLCCVFSPIDCDDMYLPHSSSPPHNPPFFSVY